jgi:carnitine O-acetyltransferase
VGVLTTENRSTWAKVRQQMIDADEGNHATLEAIQRALFVVRLDDGQPQNADEYARVALHGDGRNRWFDKSFQIIVQANGHTAINAEHSGIDGSTLLSLFEYAVSGDASQDTATPPSATLSPVERLRWTLTPDIERTIAIAEVHFDQLVANLGLKTLTFEHFGKNQIKQCKLSPDGFVQMALQLAHFKLHGACAPTYESAQTRLFFHGRTETIRSCSLQSLEFVQAMTQPDCPVETKRELLRKAVEWHTHQTREAMRGRGVDRHLLGLRLLAIEAGMELPALFKDPAYQFGWRLSTSQVPTRSGSSLGFGPVTTDGYGIRDESLSFHITDWTSCPRTDIDRFAQTLEQCLLEMRDVALER